MKKRSSASLHRFTACALLASSLGTAFFAACGGDDTPPPSSLLDATGGSDTSREGATLDGDTSSDGSTDAPDGSIPLGDATADGNNVSDTNPGVDAAPPPLVCSSLSSLAAAGAALPISTGSDDWLGSVSPDELSIAWTAGNSGAFTVYYSDRSATSNAFGTPKVLAGSFAFDRVALSPDGLTIVAVSANRKSFAEFARASRTDAFGAGNDTFVNINDDAVGMAASFGDPVFAPNSFQLYYSVYDGTATSTIYSTQRIFKNDNWQSGTPIPSPNELKAQGALRRRPTGLSSDSRILFYYDEVASKSFAATYTFGATTFDKFTDLGAVSGVQVNNACSRFYFSRTATNVDLFATP